MLARFYIEESDFSGVDVLKDKPDAARNRLLTRIELLTELLGFIILLTVLAALVAANH